MRDKIKRLRANTGFTQTAFAQLVGVSVSSLRRWESGQTLPSPLAQIKLEEIMAAEKNNDIKKLIKKSVKKIQLNGEMKINFKYNNINHKCSLMPFVVNGPEDQNDFHKMLIKMQEHDEVNIDWDTYKHRLSLIKDVDGCRTAQYELELPKDTSKSWSSDYGSHGWHRYVGRFPAPLIRAIINYFSIVPDDIILDPFCGSGTTLVEARLLGISAIGIEVSPLSSLISRVKSQFIEPEENLLELPNSLEVYYIKRWDIFMENKTFTEISYDEILNRNGNLIKRFSNIEKWFSKEALLGTSIVVEFLQKQPPYYRDILAVALSAKMRSIGNVDVDVVRAEYRKLPRENVDVLKLVKSQLAKMAKAINMSYETHKELIGSPNSIRVIEDTVLNADIKDGSISYIITSPPYGVESISYLRTHLLSFRALECLLGLDPYKFNEEVIGSEYLDDDVLHIENFGVSNSSKTYKSFFDELLNKSELKKHYKRITMMMKFFEDMNKVIKKFAVWLKPGGKVAFIIGNKKIDKYIIPTDDIFKEIFEYNGFDYIDSIEHKLKTNNSNSKVPWQDNIIENEFAMFFKKSEVKQ